MAAVVERERCPMCGAGAIATLRRVAFEHPSLRGFVDDHFAGRLRARELVGRFHEVDRCDACSFVFHRYVLARPALERLYETWRPTGDPRDARCLALALERGGASERRRRRVLDVGAADGGWCRAAREHGLEPVAVELCERARKHLDEIGVEAVEEARDVEADSIAFARCAEVLEHVADPVGVLRSVARALAPAGRVLVAVPDARTAARRIAESYWQPRDDALRPLEHVNGFTPRTLALLARRAELAVAARIRRTRGGGLEAVLQRRE